MQEAILQVYPAKCTEELRVYEPLEMWSHVFLSKTTHPIVHRL